MIKKQIVFMAFLVFTTSLYTSLFGNTVDENQLTIFELTCEYQRNPIGIGTLNPTLRWKVNSLKRSERVTAYQIIVASTTDLINQNIGDVWDTSKVENINNVEVRFNGKTLLSSQKYYWKVKVWGINNNESLWSEVAHFEMGLLNESKWKAVWISEAREQPINDEDFYNDHPAPMFRKEFSLNKVKKARLYISGLGYYEAYINGKRVGNHQLDPGWTSYDKRVFYSTYDVTDLLKNGNNAIGAILGNGWFNPLPLRLWGTFNLRTSLDLIGKPMLLAQLRVEYDDGTIEYISTDESWKTEKSPILKNNIYLGEVYDSRKEIPNWNRPDFDDSKWSDAILSENQLNNLEAQPISPIRITKKITPISLTNPKPGVYVYDMGQNFAGWIQFKTNGKSGTIVKFKYGELIHADGNLNGLTTVVGQIKKPGLGGPGSPDIAWQSDEFILNGDIEQSFSPRFTFHGFRYVEVTGLENEPAISDMVGLRLNTDVTPTGTFACSNEMFNKLYDIIDWTFLSNLYSVQSDCPAREKFGYGGDIVPVSDAYIHYYDMTRVYPKIARDFGDATRNNGSFTETAPFIEGIDDGGFGGGSGPIGWSLAHSVLLEKMYQYYGNKELIKEQYDYSKDWLNFIIKQTDNYIIQRGIGDHEQIDPSQTELVNSKLTPVTSTAFFYDAAMRVARLAKIIDKKEDYKKYVLLAEKIKTAYIDDLLIKGTAKFGLGTQTHQSFALKFNLIPENLKREAMASLLDTIRIKHNDHLSTGIFGTKYLFDVLTDNGEAELAYKIANQRTFPSWGNMLENGATTLWEHWDFSDDVYSHNHPMFGSISHWFVRVLAGIRLDDEAVGYDKIIIKPEILGDLTWAKASYNSVQGEVMSSWEIKEGRFNLDVNIPVNSTAKIYIPSNSLESVFEGDIKLSEVEGVRILKFLDRRVLVEVGSGNYSFKSKFVNK